MKPDYVVRGLRILIVLLLTVQICSQVFPRTGRYVLAHFDASGVIVLDTQTGSMYIFGYQTKLTVKIDVVEQSRDKSLAK